MSEEIVKRNKKEVEVNLGDHYKKYLMDALLLQPLQFPKEDCQDMRNLITGLYQGFSEYEGLNKSGEIYKKHRYSFTQIMLNLYVSYLDLLPFSMGLGKKNYSTDNRLRKIFLTYTATQNVWKYLVKEKLMVRYKGFNGKIHRVTRFAPSEKLYKLFQEIGEFRPEPLERNTSAIELRDKNKNPIVDFLNNPQKYMEIDEYNRIVDFLNRYNKFIDQQDLSMIIYNEIISDNFAKKTLSQSKRGKVLLTSSNLLYDIICSVRTNIPQIINYHNFKNMDNNHKIHKTETLKNGKVIINSNYHYTNRYIYNINPTNNNNSNTLLGGSYHDGIRSFSHNQEKELFANVNKEIKDKRDIMEIAEILETHKELNIQEINNIQENINTLLGRFSGNEVGSFSPQDQTVNIEYVIDKILNSKIDFSKKPTYFASSFEYTLKDKSVTRIFNNSSVSQGGRFYCDLYQNIPSNLRQYLYFNGERTRELDFKGHHVNILYKMKGIPFVGDPYSATKGTVKLPATTGNASDTDGSGYEVLSNNNGNGVVFTADNESKQDQSVRNKMKIVMLVIFNAESKEEAIEGIRYKLSKMGYTHGLKDEDIEQMIDHFEVIHRPLKEYFYSGIGLELQKIDSEMTMDILESMMNKGIPTLPIHDSYICPESNAEYLEIQMRTSYMKVLQRFFDEKGLSHPVTPPEITWNNQSEINYAGVDPIQKVA